MLVEQEVQAEITTATVSLGNESGSSELCGSAPLASEAEQLLSDCRTAAQFSRWERAEQLALAGVKRYPSEPLFHTQLAWAVYRQDRTIEAFEIIHRAAGIFRNSVAVAYTVACLHGALLRPSEAERWLMLAIEKASNPEKVKLRSLVQPELQCLWNE